MQTDFDWTVVGAGPAGIAVVGQLLDNDISPDRIAWIDPTFTVGDFGTIWRKVPSNTKVKLFLRFLDACQAFKHSECCDNFPLHSLEQEKTCQLSYMADALQWVTNHLKETVHARQTSVTTMKLTQQHWEISLESDVIVSKNVVLTIGSDPITLPTADIELVPLDVTFDPERLSAVCTKNDTVAVFGSSHSAILIIRNLLEHCQVKKIINFYRSPLIYAFEMDGEIIYDDTGLKGTTAEWAREFIDGTLPDNVFRVISTDESVAKYIGECTKSIHAVGFAPRTIVIEGIQELKHDDKTGIIAPGLFGLGIAFPESKTNRYGNVERRVGLWKFMEYLKRIMPVWLQYHT